MALIERVRNFYDQANHLGWARTAQLRAFKRLGVPEIRVKVEGVPNRVAVRTADSDIYDFNHSLGPWREPLNLGFTPNVIVDAGANVGYSVLRFLLEYPDAKIIAVEPGPDNLTQFAKNCAGYPNLSVEPHALWTHKAELRIFNPEEGSNAFRVAEEPGGPISSLSVDDIIARHSLDRIDLLKMDIEGSEIEVFSDCADWIPKVEALLVETHDRIRPGCSDAVRQAVAGHMTFQGHVNEYEYYRRAVRT
jgi:FkbM family methyltransferase